MATLAITQLQNSENLSIDVSNQIDTVSFHFDPQSASIAQNGNNLEIMFTTGEKIVLNSFYTAFSSGQLPSFEVAGRSMTADDFFASYLTALEQEEQDEQDEKEEAKVEQEKNDKAESNQGEEAAVSQETNSNSSYEEFAEEKAESQVQQNQLQTNDESLDEFATLFFATNSSLQEEQAKPEISLFAFQENPEPIQENKAQANNNSSTNYGELADRETLSDFFGGDGNSSVHGRHIDDILLGDGSASSLVSIAGKFSLTNDMENCFGNTFTTDDVLEQNELDFLADLQNMVFDFDSLDELKAFADWSESSLEGMSDGDDIIHARQGDDLVLGLGGDDTLYGHRDCDILIGGTGHDTLIGGNGADILIGGSGKDIFVWTESTIGDKHTDIIVDFVKGEDLIDLSSFKIGEHDSKFSLSLRNEAGNSIISIKQNDTNLQEITLSDTLFSNDDLDDILQHNTSNDLILKT